jgi:cytochrome b6-f complex iron-sulfur subunit
MGSEFQSKTCTERSRSIQNPKSKMIKRRSFVKYFSVGWLASCFPVVLAACTPAGDKNAAKTSIPEPSDGAAEAKGVKKPSTAKTADGFTPIGTVADLDKAGYLQNAAVAVSRNPANPKQLLAVSPKCTHKGCVVAWQPGAKKYECPCHEAAFGADGKVLKGPATKALPTYTAKIVGTQVLVKV